MNQQQPVLSHEAPVYDRQNLPVPPPIQLIGRSSDLDVAQRTLKAGGAVLLYGSPGTGKTAIAATLAASYAHPPGGVVWLDVAGDTLLSLVNRVARAYDLPPASFADDVAAHTASVRAVLQDNNPLIVLDGHVRIEAARVFVRECAAGTPLVLTYPQLAAGPWTPQAVRVLEHDDGIALFVQQTEDAVDAELTRLAALNDVLAGHPLSICVAARQVALGDVSPGDVLDHMPDLPAGEKNRVMGVLMAAYRLLPPDLQGMVMLLGSAFAGGGSDVLLADASGAPVEAIRARMRQVAAHGFAVECLVLGQPYFVAHELVQEFAQAFLRGKKQLQTMQARHMQGLAAYLRCYSVEAETVDHSRVAAEMRSVLAASRHAAEAGNLDGVRELAHMLEAGADSGFAAVSGFQAEVEWLNYLVEHPDAAGEGVLGCLPEPKPPVEAAETAPFFQDQDTVQAQSLADVGLEPLDLDDLEPEPETLPGAVTEATPKAPPLPEALPESDADLPSPAAVELPADTESLHKLGQMVADQDDANAEIVRYSEALQSYRADGNVADELAAIQALAQLNLESANYEEVLRYVDQGIELAQQTENPRREGELLVLLGDLQFSLGHFTGAETAYREAISALRPTDAWLDIGLTLEKMGEVYLQQDRLQDAIDVWQQTIPIFERVKRQDLVRSSLDALGDIHFELMDWTKARASYSMALQMAEEPGDDDAIFSLLSKLGQLAEDSGDRDGALTFYRRALHRAYDLDDESELGYTLLAAARLLLDDTQQLNRTLQLLQAAEPLLPEVSEVKRLLGRAKTRRERLVRAGVKIPVVEGTPQDYALEAEDEG